MRPLKDVLGAVIDQNAVSKLPLAIRQKVKLSARGLPPIIGNVCWRSSDAYGLVFQQLFTFEELARLAAQLQASSQPSDHSPDNKSAARRCA